MNNRIRYLVLFFIILFGTDSQAGMNLGLSTSAGLPQGYLNWSLNETVYARFSSKLPFDWELASTGCTSFKNHEMGGAVGFISASFYMLGRYDVSIAEYGFKPFISAGLGEHNIYSLNIGENPVISGISKLGNPWRFTLKSHLFAGCDYKFDSGYFITLHGRATYPSDIMFDSVYLGFGKVIR
ncbi:hypothetical protein K9N50_06160 [bacterium]|nr:hypothetical protein [bacterium]